eukprot:10286435-Heterocapsa_arctica.AAC.1
MWSRPSGDRICLAPVAAVAAGHAVAALWVIGKCFGAFRAFAAVLLRGGGGGGCPGTLCVLMMC